MSLRYSTNNVLEAVKGQIEKVASDYIEHVYIYDGSLQQAIDSHLSQGAANQMKTFAFIAVSDESPLQLAASGMPLQTGLFIDINVIAIASGRSRYAEDLRRLLDAVDCVAQEVFCNSCDKLSQDYRDIIKKTQFERRQRLTVEDPVLAHVVRIMVKV